MINSSAFQNFKKYINIATEKGEIIYGGKIIDEGDLKYGYYVMPTIVNGLSSENILLKKELFLPFLCIKEYDRFDEAMAMCNNSEYGLTAGIFSNDKKYKGEKMIFRVDNCREFF